MGIFCKPSFNFVNHLWFTKNLSVNHLNYKKYRCFTSWFTTQSSNFNRFINL